MSVRIFWDRGYTRRLTLDGRVSFRELMQERSIYAGSVCVVNGKHHQAHFDKPLASALQNGDTLCFWSNVGRVISKPRELPAKQDELNHADVPSVVLCDVKFNYVTKHICLPGILKGQLQLFQPEAWLIAQPPTHTGLMDGFSEPIETYYRTVLQHEPTMSTYVMSFVHHLQDLLNSGSATFPINMHAHPNFRVELLRRWLDQVKSTGCPFASPSTPRPRGVSDYTAHGSSGHSQYPYEHSSDREGDPKRLRREEYDPYSRPSSHPPREHDRYSSIEHPHDPHYRR